MTSMTFSVLRAARRLRLSSDASIRECVTIAAAWCRAQDHIWESRLGEQQREVA